MDCQQIINFLNSQANPKNVAGMARYGINPQNTLGVKIPVLRQLAKKIGKNHKLALELWKTRIHEARILAVYIDDVEKVTARQMDSWAKEFDSWDVCDQACNNLFDQTPFAYQKAAEWSTNQKEFVKRAGFSLMASLAVHDKKADNKKLEQFFPLVIKGASDDRNFVKKAANWALRQIGKRNLWLNEQAIKTAHEIKNLPGQSAQWIANHALKELLEKKEKIKV